MERLVSAIYGGENICICGIVLTEILQGIKSEDQYRKVKKLLSELIYLPMPCEVYELAADIYRNARKNGKTIRNTIDCIIAACSIVHNIPLLHKDKDFVTIADVSKLKIINVN